VVQLEHLVLLAHELVKSCPLSLTLGGGLVRALAEDSFDQ